MMNEVNALTVNSMSMALPVPVSSFENYVQAVNAIPVLSKEEEFQLARNYREKGDLRAAEKLVLSQLRYVVYIARGYAGYGLPIGDLVQEGNVGLMKSVKRFDPSVGVRLVSFAVHWIRAEIHEFILKNWRIVKIATTKAQRKLFFNLRSRKKRLGWFRKEEVDQVAKDLGVKPETVLEMESRLSGADITFDNTNDDNDDGYQSPVDYLQDTRHEPAAALEKADLKDHNENKLKKALVTLDERSKDILTSRWLQENKSTLQDLATKYQVSAERIRQLESNAMKKLRKIMED